MLCRSEARETPLSLVCLAIQRFPNVPTGAKRKSTKCIIHAMMCAFLTDIISIQVRCLQILPLNVVLEQEFDGCWEDVKPDIKIQVERCGCDAAYKVLLSPTLMVVSLVVAVVMFAF